MGINGIRTEGKEMPQNFYDQMDRAGILIDAGFQCCDKWAPSGSGRGVTSQEFHVMYESSLTIGERLRDHPSVLNYSWSDNPPINEQEAASLAGFSQSGFQDPIISSAEYNVSGVLGPSGEKEGPYDWVPPDYWYDSAHSSNNGNDNDSTMTNVGGAWGFDSEQGSGDTVPTMDSLNRFMSPADQATLWQQPDAHQFHTNYESTDGSHSGYSFGTLDNLDTAIKARYGSWSSLPQYVQEAQVQNYEDIRAQFEAYIDHWSNGADAVHRHRLLAAEQGLADAALGPVQLRLRRGRLLLRRQEGQRGPARPLRLRHRPGHDRQPDRRPAAGAVGPVEGLRRGRHRARQTRPPASRCRWRRSRSATAC